MEPLRTMDIGKMEILMNYNEIKLRSKNQIKKSYIKKMKCFICYFVVNDYNSVLFPIDDFLYPMCFDCLDAYIMKKQQNLHRYIRNRAVYGTTLTMNKSIYS
jgi:hypothetical protein